jgi:hypothetical protein
MVTMLVSIRNKCTFSLMCLTNMADYSQVDMLGVWYKYVDFGAIGAVSFTSPVGTYDVACDYSGAILYV